MMLINNEINLPVNTSQSAVDGPLVGVVAWDIKTKVVKKRKNGLSMHTHTHKPPEQRTSGQLYVGG